MTDLAVLALLVAGALLVAVAALGVYRMPDFLLRMSASTKATTLGTFLVVLGAAIHFGTLAVATRAAAILAFLALTAPLAAHLLARAGHAAGARTWEGTRVDEYRGRR